MDSIAPQYDAEYTLKYLAEIANDEFLPNDDKIVIFKTVLNKEPVIIYYNDQLVAPAYVVQSNEDMWLLTVSEQSQAIDFVAKLGLTYKLGEL